MSARLRLVVLLGSLAAAACSSGPATNPNAGTPASVVVTSTAFEDRGAVPTRFTCDGEATSPPLAWTTRSEEPRAWALVVDDPDAPGGTYVHWVVLDIPAATRSVAPGVAPAGAVEAITSAGRTGYTPPCPPSGTHRYRFSVYALSARTGLADGARLDDALKAIRSLAVSRGTLVGTYQRQRP